jgi:hypothetical protein
MREQEWSREELRLIAFDYLRDDLDEVRTHAVEEAMIASEEFAQYVSRVQALIDETRRAEQDVEIGIDADVLFEQILQAVSSDDASEKPAVVLEFQTALVEKDAGLDERLRTAPMWWAAAAVVLFGTLVYLVTQVRPVHVLPGQLAQEGSPVADRVDENQLPKSDEQARASAVALALGALRVQDSGTKAIQVHASSDAEWSVSGSERKRVVTLQNGTILVEFLPGEVDSLDVVSERFKVEVVGTIFYASEESSTVGVLAGEVLLTPRGEETLMLTDGEAWTFGRGVYPVEADVTGIAGNHVDVRTHVDLLERVADEASGRLRLAKRSRRKARTSAVDSRRVNARRAMSDGRYEDAARLLEELVREGAADDASVGRDRLDLARIYIREVVRPGRAETHLRRFIESRPADPATPSARAELCRILGRRARVEPQCEP